jgi:hypothetical protein
MIGSESNTTLGVSRAQEVEKDTDNKQGEKETEPRWLLLEEIIKDFRRQIQDFPVYWHTTDTERTTKEAWQHTHGRGLPGVDWHRDRNPTSHCNRFFQTELSDLPNLTLYCKGGEAVKFATDPEIS